METFKGYVQFMETRPTIGNIVSFVVDPEIGNVELVHRFRSDLLSTDPSTVQRAIEQINDSDIPLHIAASGFKQFVERDEFNEKQVYEQVIFNLPYGSTPPDFHLQSSRFVETTGSFRDSVNRLVLTRRGLERLQTKMHQPQYKIMRSYEQHAVETCFIASTELIANAIENPVDPVPESFLHECSLGVTVASYFHLFGTDAADVYNKSRRGIDLLYEHGSWRDQEAIEQVREKLAV